MAVNLVQGRLGQASRDALSKSSSQQRVKRQAKSYAMLVRRLVEQYLSCKRKPSRSISAAFTTKSLFSISVNEFDIEISLSKHLPRVFVLGLRARADCFHNDLFNCSAHTTHHTKYSPHVRTHDLRD